MTNWNEPHDGANGWFGSPRDRRAVRGKTGRPERAPFINDRLRDVVCRLASVALFAGGLFYWTRLIGVYDGLLWRFDTMPIWWRIATPVLAVLYPIAGVGLWLIASWGIVIWTLVFAIEAIMHLGFARLFGTAPAQVGLHAFGLVALLMLRVAALPEQRRK
nr:DUF6163 family protein [Aureimonas jatrophae]